MEFEYLPTFLESKRKKQIIYLPMVPVRLGYGHRILPYEINGLVDSRAGRSLFPAYFAFKLGINLKKGGEQKILGIGGIRLCGYTHKIRLYIGEKSFDSVMDFSEAIQVPLLGRQGFFELFRKIVFDEVNKKLVIKD